jgi:Secreted repeat of unknown function
VLWRLRHRLAPVRHDRGAAGRQRRVCRPAWDHARTGGTTEVTYHGHPLYYYAADSKPGDTNGQGVKAFGAEWYVLSPAGDKVEKEGS